MIRLIIILLLFLIQMNHCLGQNGVQLTGHIGYIVPNNRVFPEIRTPSYMVKGTLLNHTAISRPRWASFYKDPILGYNLSYEHFGNRDALGGALSLIPSLSFYLVRKDRFSLQLQSGLGLAFLTKPFNKITNPDNTINGSHLNFAALTSLLLSVELKEGLFLESGPSVTHYSNGNYAKPNVGSNVPDWFVGIRYQLQNHPKEQDSKAILPYSKRFHPFLRVGYGFTEKSLDGPKYPVLEGTIGINRQFGVVNRVNMGVSMLHDNRAFRFQEHLGLNEGSRFRFSNRYVWFMGHEFLFGHVGFLTEGGFYLNKFEGKSSFLSAKIGFNFYLNNNFDKTGFLPYLGVYIHSSFGEAEFIELSAGISF